MPCEPEGYNSAQEKASERKGTCLLAVVAFCFLIEPCEQYPMVAGFAESLGRLRASARPGYRVKCPRDACCYLATRDFSGPGCGLVHVRLGLVAFLFFGITGIELRSAEINRIDFFEGD